jgi:hypothetical protein
MSFPYRDRKEQMMETKIDFQEKEIADLEVGLVTEGLNTLRLLAWSVDGDIYTDAPECQARINQAQDALQKAYDVLERISLTVLKVHEERAAVQAEALSRRILDEAEEAFAAKSMAVERALLGNWPRPGTVSDYLFWIEDEAWLQETLVEAEPDGGRDLRIYIQALHGLAEELRDLGFKPSPAPWEAEISAVRS